jgi:hypothetical protein
MSHMISAVAAEEKQATVGQHYNKAGEARSMHNRHQSRLLYLLQEGQIRRLGRNRFERLACQELLLVIHASLPSREAYT